MRNESYASEKKRKTGIKRIINAYGYSKDGLKAAYRHESAFRQVCWLNLTLVILACIFDFDFSVRLLLITELFNTAVEAAVDHTSTEKHELAKRAKDAGSAAQLAALVLLAVTWLSALWHTYI